MSEALPPPPGVPDWAWEVLARRDGDRWAIIERNAVGEPVGTAYRLRNGDKDFKAGGKRGLILKWPLANYAGMTESDPIFVVEGASDTAALMGLSLDAVGLPAANTALDMLAELLVGRHVVIVADADDAGRRSAKKSAAALVNRCLSVRVIEPPEGAKDARAAVIAGAGQAAFLDLVAAAPVFAVEPEPTDGAPVLVRLSEVKAEPIEWLWSGRIAVGKLTLLAGAAGLGKSIATLDMAARISRGAPWSDRPGIIQPAGDVVLLNAEDGLADTVVPRLEAAGADMNRIRAIEAVHSMDSRGRRAARPFDLERDLAALEAAIKSARDCRFVVLDPVTAYLGKVDSHNNAEVRALLAPLSALAARYRVAVLAVTHLNKNTTAKALDRVMGSVAFGAAARGVWLVVQDNSDRRRRLLLPGKNNLGQDLEGLAYRIEPRGANAPPVVAWEPEPVRMSADDALTGDPETHSRRTERGEAADWLRDVLSEGPVLVTELQRGAKDAGHSWATIRRAKNALGIEPHKRGFRGPSEWILPGHLPKDDQALLMDAKDAHPLAGERLCGNTAEIDASGPKALTSAAVSNSDERRVAPAPSLDADGGRDDESHPLDLASLLLDLGRANIDLADLGRPDGLDLPAHFAARLRPHRADLLALLEGYTPDDEEACHVMGERLGVADDLGMPTYPGSPAWLIAAGESM